MYRALLQINTNRPGNFIPKKYLLPGTRLFKDDGTYYTILDNYMADKNGSWRSPRRDNGEFAGIDGQSISVALDQKPIDGDQVYITPELAKLIVRPDPDFLEPYGPL